MKNKEKFKDEIFNIVVANEDVSLALSRKNNKFYKCCDILCSDCAFSSLYNNIPCNKNRKKWFDEQYKEPIIISNAEYVVLSRIIQLIKWEDEDPYAIKELITEYYKNMFKNSKN